MAEQLESFNFGRMRHSGNGSYDEYLFIGEEEDEGAIWKLTVEDSPSKTANIRSMQTSLNGAARRRGLRVRTNVIVEDEVEYLVMQAYRPQDIDEDE